MARINEYDAVDPQVGDFALGMIAAGPTRRLRLGDAAAAALTVSSLDVTVDRIWKNRPGGMFGIGNTGPAPVLDASATELPSGMYRWQFAQGHPGVGPTQGNYHIIHNRRDTNAGEFQIWFGEETPSRLFTRWRTAAAWSSFQEIHHVNNVGTAATRNIGAGANDLPDTAIIDGRLAVKAETSITLTAGDGLTGGGNLTADRTFTLGTPSTLSGGSTNAVTAESHTHAITGAALTTSNDTNVTLSLTGGHTQALLNSASISAGWSGLLAVSRGGTGVSSVTARHALLGPSTTGAPTWRAITFADISDRATATTGITSVGALTAGSITSTFGNIDIGSSTITAGSVAATTFTGALVGNASTVTNGVYTSGDQTIAGVKTFSSIPVGPASNPTTDNELTRKAYVDSQLTSTVPSGTVSMFAGASAPSGWLFCQGQAESRTTYAALFAAIGTTYGAGDGSTTFLLPDFRNITAYGANASTRTISGIVHPATALGATHNDRMQQITGQINSSGDASRGTFWGPSGAFTVSGSGTNTDAVVGGNVRSITAFFNSANSSGSRTGSTTMSAGLGINFIIKV